MSYGRNFGMRSFENIIRDARFRTPATGTPLKIGQAVEVDPDNVGRMRPVAAGAAPTAASGVVVYEHIQNKSDALTTSHDAPYDSVPLGVYAQIMHGPGVKVWYRNTEAKTAYDGRQRAEVEVVTGDLTDMKPGDGLSPAADGKWAATAADGDAWLIVEQVNPTTGLVEARFAF